MDAKEILRSLMVLAALGAVVLIATKASSRLAAKV